MPKKDKAIASYLTEKEVERLNNLSEETGQSKNTLVRMGLMLVPDNDDDFKDALKKLLVNEV